MEDIVLLRAPGEVRNQREAWERATDHLRRQGWPMPYVEPIRTPEDFVRIYKPQAVN